MRECGFGCLQPGLGGSRPWRKGENVDLDAFVRSVLGGELSAIPAEEESRFHEEWVARGLSFREPFEMAVQGGAIADRLAWVFVSGYQATSRRVFPGVEPVAGWASFVNTEVQSELPPTRLAIDADGNAVLRGWKTWVATSAHVSRLFVSSGPGRIPFAVVAGDQPGVEIETSPRKSYLGDMTQGRVFFRDVVVPRECVVADARTFVVFGACESAYVRVAFHAFMLAQGRRLGARTEFLSRVIANLYAAERILGGEFPSELSAVAINGVHLAGLELAGEFAALTAAADPELHARWIADRRLIDGVTAGLGSRATRTIEGLVGRPG